MRTITIMYKDNLIGYIKIQDNILKDLKPNEALLLVKQLNRGDSTIVTFRLQKMEVDIA